MKYLLLASAAILGLAVPAQAALLSTTTTETLPPFSSIIAPTPSASLGWASSTASVISGGTTTALSPFAGVSGYTSAPFSYVLGGAANFATYTKTDDPSFVTGGDSFSFIFGSPDSYNTISFFKGKSEIGSITGSDAAFGTKGSGYYVTTVSGLGDYDSVEFQSTSNSVEYATFNVSSVPLPASLPMFGGAVLALGLFAAWKRNGVSTRA